MDTQKFQVGDRIRLLIPYWGEPEAMVVSQHLGLGCEWYVRTIDVPFELIPCWEDEMELLERTIEFP
jgi:hypothetical protein